MGNADGRAAEGPTIRLNGLTGLRWWAAFIVFLYHVQVFAPIPDPFAAVLRQGYLGVTFFFVLSGFVLTWSFSPKVSKSTFYWRRFARIFPLHAIAWVLAVPVFYTFVAGSAPAWVQSPDPWALGLSFVLLHGWFLAPAILFAGNPAAWTLTCEAFFYAIHPFVQRVLRGFSQRGPLVVAASMLLLVVAMRVGAWIWPTSAFASIPTPLLHTPGFIIGMCAAWAIRQGWRPRISVTFGLAALAAVVAAIALVPRYLPGTVASEVVSRLGTELFTIACFVTIVAVASSAMRGVGALFADRTHVRLGEWSFAFYLVHATVMYAVMRFVEPLSPSWNNVVPATVLLIVSIALSGALYHGVEKPVESRMRQWKNQRDNRRESQLTPVGSIPG